VLFMLLELWLLGLILELRLCNESLWRDELDWELAQGFGGCFGVYVVNLHGEGTAAAVQRFEGCLGGAAAGVWVCVVQVPEEGDAFAMLEIRDEEVFDYVAEGAGGGGVFFGAEDDPG
jgi:hypothetical protein